MEDNVCVCVCVLCIYIPTSTDGQSVCYGHTTCISYV